MDTHPTTADKTEQSLQQEHDQTSMQAADREQTDAVQSNGSDNQGAEGSTSSATNPISSAEERSHSSSGPDGLGEIRTPEGDGSKPNPASKGDETEDKNGGEASDGGGERTAEREAPDEGSVAEASKTKPAEASRGTPDKGRENTQTAKAMEVTDDASNTSVSTEDCQMDDNAVNGGANFGASSAAGDPKDATCVAENVQNSEASGANIMPSESSKSDSKGNKKEEDTESTNESFAFGRRQHNSGTLASFQFASAPSQTYIPETGGYTGEDRGQESVATGGRPSGRVSDANAPLAAGKTDVGGENKEKPSPSDLSTESLGTYSERNARQFASADDKGVSQEKDRQLTEAETADIQGADDIKHDLNTADLQSPPTDEDTDSTAQRTNHQVEESPATTNEAGNLSGSPAEAATIGDREKAGEASAEDDSDHDSHSGIRSRKTHSSEKESPSGDQSRMLSEPTEPPKSPEREQTQSDVNNDTAMRNGEDSNDEDRTSVPAGLQDNSSEEEIESDAESSASIGEEERTHTDSAPDSSFSGPERKEGQKQPPAAQRDHQRPELLATEDGSLQHEDRALQGTSGPRQSDGSTGRGESTTFKLGTGGVFDYPFGFQRGNGPRGGRESDNDQKTFFGLPPGMPDLGFIKRSYDNRSPASQPPQRPLQSTGPEDLEDESAFFASVSTFQEPPKHTFPLPTRETSSLSPTQAQQNHLRSESQDSSNEDRVNLDGTSGYASGGPQDASNIQRSSESPLTTHAVYQPSSGRSFQAGHDSSGNRGRPQLERDTRFTTPSGSAFSTPVGSSTPADPRRGHRRELFPEDYVIGPSGINDQSSIVDPIQTVRREMEALRQELSQRRAYHLSAEASESRLEELQQQLQEKDDIIQRLEQEKEESERHYSEEMVALQQRMQDQFSTSMHLEEEKLELLDTYGSTVGGHTQEVTLLRQDIQEKSKTIERLDDQLQKLREHVHRELNKKNDAIAEVSQLLTDERSRREQAQATNAELNSRIEAATKEISDLQSMQQQQLQEKDDTIQRLTKEKEESEKQAKANSAELNSRIEAMTEQISGLQRKNAELQGEKGALGSRLENAEMTAESFGEQIRNLEESQMILQKELKEEQVVKSALDSTLKEAYVGKSRLEETLSQQQKECEDLQDEIKELKSRLDEAERSAQSNEEEKEKLQNDIAELRPRLDNAEKTAERYKTEYETQTLSVTELATAKEQLEEERDAWQALAQQGEVYRDQLNAALLEKDTIETQKIYLEGHLATLTQQIVPLQAEYWRLGANEQQLTRTIAEKDKRIEELTAQLQQKDEKILLLQAEAQRTNLAVENAMNRLEQTQVRVRELEERERILREEIEIAANAVSRSHRQEEYLKSLLTQKEQQQQRLMQDKETLERQIRLMKEENKRLRLRSQT